MYQRQLLGERLIACANLVPGVESLFRWRGKRERAGETGAIFKTTAVRLDKAMTRLREIHPYDAPAITGWPVIVDADTLAWLRQETREP